MAMIAFGEGPKMCVGKNFALFQIKIAIATIIQKYKVELSEKMVNPPSISTKAFLLHCDTGVWVKFVKRK